MKKLTALFTFAIFLLVVGGAITPARAHCVTDGVHSGDHPHCRNEGGGPEGGGIYDVTVSDSLISSSTFTGHDGGGRSKPVNVSFQFIDLDLSFFSGKFGMLDSDDRGMQCFTTGAPFAGNLTAMTISQEKDGNAFVQYYFTGRADDGTTEVNYLLEMFGIFDFAWRPVGITTTAMVTSWEMSINGTGGVRNIACKGSGSAPFSTNIGVTEPPSP